MTRLYKFQDSRAKIEKSEGGFAANCQCGWRSELNPTKEAAIIAFEGHVRSDPKHRIAMEEEGTSLSSLFLAVVGILYVLSPIDIIPDYFVLVGWIEDILIGVLSVILIKKGLQGKSPRRILSDIFG